MTRNKITRRVEALEAKIEAAAETENPPWPQKIIINWVDPDPNVPRKYTCIEVAKFIGGVWVDGKRYDCDAKGRPL